MTDKPATPMAYLHEHALHGPALDFGQITEADKDAGWIETPLYAGTPEAATLPQRRLLGEFVDMRSRAELAEGENERLRKAISDRLNAEREHADRLYELDLSTAESGHDKAVAVIQALEALLSNVTRHQETVV